MSFFQQQNLSSSYSLFRRSLFESSPPLIIILYKPPDVFCQRKTTTHLPNSRFKNVSFFGDRLIISLNSLFFLFHSLPCNTQQQKEILVLVSDFVCETTTTACCSSIELSFSCMTTDLRATSFFFRFLCRVEKDLPDSSLLPFNLSLEV